jgi:hypothetical protein
LHGLAQTVKQAFQGLPALLESIPDGLESSDVFSQEFVLEKDPFL